jgi:uncharacterized protein YcfL
MKKTIFILFFLFVCISLLIAGCSADTDATTSDQSTTTTSSTSSTTTTALEITLTQTPTFIQGQEYGLKLLNIEKSSKEITTDVDKYGSNYIIPPENFTFIKVKIQIYRHGNLLSSNEIVSSNEVQKISLIDSNASIFQVSSSIHEWQLVNSEWQFSDILIVFSVPENGKGFKLLYRDLPLIDLGM